METLAFVEELGRHGDVVRRHPLRRLPARIGRGYEADVVIDDPHIAAQHLEIRPTTDGGLEAVDLGSLNGTLRRGNAARIGTIRIHGDEVLRIGHTQLRIRLPGHVVAAELPLPRRTWSRHPAPSFMAMGAFAALSVWNGYVTTLDTDTSNIFSVPLMATLAVLVWATVWSAVCRSMQGSGRFWAHAIVAFLGGTAILLLDTMTEYLFFSFDLDGFELGWRCSLATAFTVILYRHLRLTVRLSPRVLGALTVSLVAVLLAGFQGYQIDRDANKPGLQAFDKTIKPSAFLFARGVAPAHFVGVAERLKARSDSDAGSTTP